MFTAGDAVIYIYVHPLNNLPLDNMQRSMGVEVTDTCLQHEETKNTTQCSSLNYWNFLSMLIFPLNMPTLNDSTQLYVYIRTHTLTHVSCCILILYIDTKGGICVKRGMNVNKYCIFILLWNLVTPNAELNTVNYFFYGESYRNKFESLGAKQHR